MPHTSGKHVPKHRQAKHRKSRSSVLATRAPRRVLRNTVMLSSVAVAATAGVVTTGVASSPVTLGTASKRVSVPEPTEEPTDERTQALRASTPLSRSGGRKDADRTKDQTPEAPESQSEEDLSEMDPREIGLALLPEYGFSTDQFSCLDALYVSESDWRVDADNPTSSAYGIPQALTSMHDLPSGYMTDPEVQIRWGLEYIKDSYGSPCSAWEFKQSNNWY
ncbi:MAG: lytic transglycosylase domain-containing protein [Nocardioides sp.]